jgi:superfamily I DNA/RNA helicase
MFNKRSVKPAVSVKSMSKSTQELLAEYKGLTPFLLSEFIDVSIFTKNYTRMFVELVAYMELYGPIFANELLFNSLNDLSKKWMDEFGAGVVNAKNDQVTLSTLSRLIGMAWPQQLSAAYTQNLIDTAAKSERTKDELNELNAAIAVSLYYLGDKESAEKYLKQVGTQQLDYPEIKLVQFVISRYNANKSEVKADTVDAKTSAVSMKAKL